MFSLLRSRILLAAAFVGALAAPLFAAESGLKVSTPSPSYIVVGFVGGFVRHDNPHHAPVQFADRIRRTMPNEAYVQVFENRHRRVAYRTILRLLDRDRDGTLTKAEKEEARIVLFGQSWGASAVVLLARELHDVGIPVLLTVQIDSVAKPWQEDRVIPDNVEAAVNFYQPHGLLHGQPEITAANPSRTRILGNYRFDYKQSPVQCNESSRWERFLTPSHAQSECDPHIWSEVEDLLRERIGRQSAMNLGSHR